jgi:hypothetical protein
MGEFGVYVGHNSDLNTRRKQHTAAAAAAAHTHTQNNMQQQQASQQRHVSKGLRLSVACRLVAQASCMQRAGC